MDGVDTGKGGDPKTVHSLPAVVSNEIEEGGGDPKTDLSLSIGIARLVGDSHHPGGWHPKLPFLLLPALNSGFLVSSQTMTNFKMDLRVLRILCTLMDSLQFHSFQNILMHSRARQKFPIIVMDSRVQEMWNIRIPYFHGICTLAKTPNESASRIPEFKSSPASGSPSELSAHQMGLSLAGASRLKQEPIHFIPGASSYAKDGHKQLSISDRALMRKYGLPGRQQEVIRKSDNETIPIEAGRVQEGSPCGLPSQVAEPPVRTLTSIPYSASSPGHFTLLYYTLVKDGALPSGYLGEFTSLEAPARRSANRLQTSAIAVTESAASASLAALRRESEHRASVEVSISDQLVIAADMRPKKFRTKWQRIVYDGPTARKDAESAERDRWIQLLANLLRATDTPMGKLIRENPSNIQLLGGGRRAGTLRSRVRSVQKFLGWLIASQGITFPTHWRQLTEYLQVRYSEPCVRGSLKLVHSS